MNARVFLVVLLTAVFMAVWDADQKAMNAALSKKQQSSVRPNQVVVIKQRSELRTIQPQSPQLPEAEVQADTIDTFIPLPRRLANGMWKAIAESGDTYCITIDRSGTGSSPVIADESPEDSFAIFTSASGDRWCFVRSRTGTLSEPRSASTGNDTSVK
jgi:hypothetical protein